MPGFGDKAYHDALVNKYRRGIREAEGRTNVPPLSRTQGGFQFTDEPNISDTVGSGTRKSDPSNPATWLLDLLSQPAYAAMQGAAEDVAGATSQDELGHIGNAAFGAIRGIFDPTNYGRGNNKNSLADVASGDAEFLDRDDNPVLSITSEDRIQEGGGTKKEAVIRVPDKSTKAFEDESGLIGMTTPQADDSADDKVSNAVTNFLLSVAGDPVSYIPGAALSKVGRVTADIAGAAPGVSRVVEAASRRYKPKAGQAAMVEASDVYGAAGRPVEINAGREFKPAVNETVKDAVADYAPANTPAPVTAEQAVANAESVGGMSLSEIVAMNPRLSILDPKVLSDAERGKFTPKIDTSNAAKSAADKGEIVQARMLRNVDTGEEIPFNGNTARRQRRSRAKDTERFADLPAPFQKVKEPRTQPVKPESVPVDTPPSLAQDDVLPNPDISTPQAWVQAFPDVQVAIRIPGSGRVTKKPVSEWIAKLNSTTAPITDTSRAAINKGLAAAWQRARSAADTAGSAPPRPVDSLSPAEAPTTLDALAKPAQGRAAARAEEQATNKANDIQLARISGTALQNLKRKYQRLLSEDDFTWLWETVRQGDPKAFAARKSKLQTVGRATGEPQYEAFMKDVIKAPPPPTAAELAAENGVIFGNDALYSALNGGVPVQEIIQAVPKTAEARAVRKAERLANADASNLDDIALTALRDAAEGQQWAEQIWPFTSKSGAARTHNTPGVGNAVYRHSANAKFQANLFNGIIDGIRKSGALEGKVGWDYANTMMGEAIPRLRAAENLLIANGVMPIGSLKSEGLPILLSDILDALSASNSGRQLLAGRFFNALGFVPRGSAVKGVKGVFDADGLILAFNAIMKGMDPAAIKTADDLVVAARSALQGKVKNLRSESARGLTQDAKRMPTTIVNGERVAASQADAKVVIKQFLDTVLPKGEDGDFRIVARMADLMRQRSAAYGIEVGDKVAALSQDTLDRMVNVIVDPNISASQMANMLGDVPGVVKRVAKSEDEVMSPAIEKAATKVTEENLTEILPQAEIQQAEGMRNISNAVAKKDYPNKKAAAQKQYNDAVAEVQTEVMTADALVDMGKVEEAALNQGIYRRLFPSSAKAPRFFAHGGNATLHSALTQYSSVGRMFRNWANDIIVRLNETYNTATIRQAYDYLRTPTANISPEVKAAAEELKNVADRLFDSPAFSGPWKKADEAQGVMRHFFAQGYDPQHIIDKMTTARLDMKESQIFDLEAAEAAVKAGRATSIEDAFGRQLLTMKVDDPLDYLSKMVDVMSTAATDMGIAHEAARIIASKGFASKTARPGFAKMDNAKSNVIARYLNTDLYYDRDILSELKVMDDILAQSTDLGGPFGQFVSRTMDPLLNMWKRGMTIYRPGHHVRNAVGDMSLSFITDGVKNPLYYYKAMAMVGARARYEGVDFLAMMQGLKPKQLADTKYTIKPTVGGKKIEVGDDEIHEALMRRGVYPDFAIQEDLLESATNPAIERMQERMSIFGGRVGRIAGNASEARDDWVRTAHALHLLENSKGFKTLDELYDHVAKRVRQTHPDGSDLTGFERKYMRRLIPFYSWTRKAIPLVVESMASHPGRTLVFPKAQLEFARQFGVEGESLGNPFPKDQLFANYFMDDVTGPAYKNDDGEYYGINPGFPTNDILNDYLGGDLKETMLGQLAPAFKVPVELATGTDLGTGAKITDRLEYLGRQIPGISHAQSLTGRKALTGFTEDIASVEKGNRENVEPNSIINLLLGLGIQNQSTPSSIRQGQIDYRNSTGG